MKPDKAIKILTLDPAELTIFEMPDFLKAVQLGSQALKRLMTMRSFNINQALLPLPGENPIATSVRSLHSIKKIMESPLSREPKG